MRNLISLLLAILLFSTLSGKKVLAQKPDIKSDEVKLMIDFIYDHYRDDYKSFGNSKILDWQKANVSMMFVHAYEVLGDKKYLEWANDALYVEYNLSDDQCWGANALVELHQHGIKPADQNYKAESGESYLMNYSYQDIFDFGLTTAPKKAPAPYFGFYDAPEINGQRGIFWNRDLSSYNSCTMGQAIILAYRIPEKKINKKSPHEFASTWLDLQTKLLIDHSSGLIYDNYQLRNKSQNRGNYSYNNGIVLGALGLAIQKDLAKHADAPEIADKVAGFVVNQMTENGVLYSPSADFRNNNAHAFNGIFMHFVPFYLFAKGESKEKNELKEFIAKCAASVWNQINESGKNQENRFTVSYSWGKPFNPAETNCMTTVSGAECILTYLQLKKNILPVDYLPK
ncbi:MAG: glycoside hydrolase family 76 protein [Prolixibacteraceae bacterium]